MIFFSDCKNYYYYYYFFCLRHLCPRSLSCRFNIFRKSNFFNSYPSELIRNGMRTQNTNIARMFLVISSSLKAIAFHDSSHYDFVSQNKRHCVANSWARNHSTTPLGLRQPSHFRTNEKILFIFLLVPKTTG
jgi:hypothetical protein